MADQYASNTDFRTSQGNVAPDYHLTSVDFTTQEKMQLQQQIEREFPGARAVRDATKTYNCHAYVHAQRHAWFNDIGPFLQDDYYPFTPGTLRINDAVVYVKDGQITHSGFIQTLNGNTILEVRSKWGQAPEMVHAPTNVPSVYGPIVYYLRRRGSRFMDSPEPTEDQLGDKVDDLLYAITRKDRLAQFMFASTFAAAERIVAGFPELTELSLFGDTARKRILARFEKAPDDELPPLLTAIRHLNIIDALPIVARKVSALVPDDSVSLNESLLLSTFESLQTRYTTSRKKTLIDAAIQMK